MGWSFSRNNILACAPTEGPFDSTNLLPHRETRWHFFSLQPFFSSRTVKQRHLLWRDIKHDKTNWVKFRELTQSRNDVRSGLSSPGLASKLNVILRCCFLFVFTLTKQGPVVDVEAEAPVLAGSYKYIHERGVRECFILIATFYSRHFWQSNIIYHNTQIDHYNYSQ